MPMFSIGIVDERRGFAPGGLLMSSLVTLLLMLLEILRSKSSCACGNIVLTGGDMFMWLYLCVKNELKVIVSIHSGVSVDKESENFGKKSKKW